MIWRDNWKRITIKYNYFIVSARAKRFDGVRQIYVSSERRFSSCRFLRFSVRITRVVAINAFGNRRRHFPISRRRRAGRQKISVHVHVVGVPPVHVALRMVIGHHEHPAGPAVRSPQAQFSRAGPHELRERTCAVNIEQTRRSAPGHVRASPPRTGLYPNWCWPSTLSGCSSAWTLSSTNTIRGPRLYLRDA